MGLDVGVVTGASPPPTKPNAKRTEEAQVAEPTEWEPQDTADILGVPDDNVTFRVSKSTLRNGILIGMAALSGASYLLAPGPGPEELTTSATDVILTEARDGTEWDETSALLDIIRTGVQSEAQLEVIEAAAEQGRKLDWAGADKVVAAVLANPDLSERQADTAQDLLGYLEYGGLFSEEVATLAVLEADQMNSSHQDLAKVLARHAKKNEGFSGGNTLLKVALDNPSFGERHLELIKTSLDHEASSALMTLVAAQPEVNEGQVDQIENILEAEGVDQTVLVKSALGIETRPEPVRPAPVRQMTRSDRTLSDKNTAAVPFEGAADLVNSFSADRQLYVSGQPLSEPEIGYIEHFLRYHPNIFVVLVEDGGDLTDDGLAQAAISRRHDYNSVVNEKTGESEAVLISVYMNSDQGRRIYLRAEELPDRLGVGERDFVVGDGGFINLFRDEVRVGGVDRGLEKLAEHINGTIDSRI